MAMSPSRPPGATSDAPATAPPLPGAPVEPHIAPLLPTEHPADVPGLIPVERRPGKALYKTLLPGVMQVPADLVLAMGRKSSLWPMTFGLACCAVEMQFDCGALCHVALLHCIHEIPGTLDLVTTIGLILFFLNKWPKPDSRRNILIQKDF